MYHRSEVIRHPFLLTVIHASVRPPTQLVLRFSIRLLANVCIEDIFSLPWVSWEPSPKEAGANASLSSFRALRHFTAQFGLQNWFFSALLSVPALLPTMTIRLWGSDKGIEVDRGFKTTTTTTKWWWWWWWWWWRWWRRWWRRFLWWSWRWL
jgi:hypothetical protein